MFTLFQSFCFCSVSFSSGIFFHQKKCSDGEKKVNYFFTTPREYVYKLVRVKAFENSYGIILSKVKSKIDLKFLFYHFY